MNTNTQLDVDLATLRRLLSRARSAAARGMWRSAMQERASRVHVVLHALTTALGVQAATRTKIANGWIVQVPPSSMPIATLSSACPARSVADLASPLCLHIHRPAELDLTRLRELERRGLVALTIDEVPT